MYENLDYLNIENTNTNEDLKNYNKNIKYKKILDNLLNVSFQNDGSTLYTKTTVTNNNEDLMTLLNEEELNLILNKPTFRIKIKPERYGILKKELDKCEDVNEFILKVKEYKLLKKSEIFVLEKDQTKFDEYKTLAINNINKKLDKFLMNWRDVKRTINESYNLAGIWPYYLGTYFIQCTVNSKPIYAPLILKEIDIDIVGNDVYLISNSDYCVLNEKLIFLLKTYKANTAISLKDNLDEIIISKLNIQLNEYYKSFIKDVDVSLIGKFINKDKDDIIQNVGNETIKVPGMVSMFANPSGSKLRKIVINLIEENKLDTILASPLDYDPFQFDNQAIDTLINKRQNIVRICQTDPSQEKAIIKALDNNLIIFGPPGTGKSQTIANILANIMHNNKTALFISQKKSALDVVIKRMQNLQFFCLQLIPKDNVSSQKQIKEDFYDNFKILFDLLTDINEIRPSSLNLKSYVSDAQKQYWELKNKYASLDEDIFKKFINLLTSYNKLNLFSFKTLKSLNQTIDKTMLNDAYYFVNKYPLLSNEIFNDLINSSECLKDENLMDFYTFYTLCLNLNLNLDNLNYLKNISNYLNEDLINKFLDLNKKYPSLNKEKFDKLKDLYNYLKQQNILETIQLSFLNTPSNIKLNIDQFAALFNFHKKGLFKKDYDKNTKDLYQQYLDVLNAIQLLQMQLSPSNFLEMFDILQLDDAKKLFAYYLSLTQYLKEHNLTIENYFSLLKYFNHESYLTKFNDFIDFFNLLKKSNISIEEYKNITSYFNNQVFKQNFDKYCLLFNTLKYLNISFEDFNKIEDILNNDTYLNLFIDFDKPYEHLPKPNTFSSDLEFLVYEQALKFEEKFNNLNEQDKKEFLKMKGKIEKAAAMPEKFLLAYKDLLKNIFPIFISNPDKLASFIDFKNDQYDYVIFDEASQIFLEKAIPYLSIAKKVIIAGDNQQMQPSNWFGIRTFDADEEDQFEEENEDSLLNYAISIGLSKQTLQSNFRSSSASLTTFSSKEFYDSELKSVNKNNVNNSSIEVINVNGTWSNSSNYEEAQKMIEVLKQNIHLYKSIILLTLNEHQLQLVNELLVKDEELWKLYFEGNIILKSLENIQGDEADLVIISIGYTKDAKLSSTYVCRPNGRNALNVAITRAKEKLIVLKSINAEEVIFTNSENKDLQTFRNWLQFLELNSEEQKEYCSLKIDLKTEFDSNFEQEVLDWLSKQTYPYPIKITNQYKVGSYRIDFAFIDEETNKFILGLEVDGFKYHFGPKKTYYDLLRQQLLEQKGYPIIRISEYNWRVNKEALYKDIINELNYLRNKK